MKRIESESISHPTSLNLRDIVGRGSKRFVRFGAAVLLLASTLLSPVDAPVRPVNAESNSSSSSSLRDLGVEDLSGLRAEGPQQVNSLTLLHGDGSRDRLNIMLLPYNGTTTKMLQDVAADIFLIPPTNEFKERVNVYKKNPEEDLKCDQNGNCDLSAINRQIDRTIDQAGVIPHETLVVVKSNQDFVGNGRATLTGHISPPDIYSSSAVVKPSGVLVGSRREFYAALIAHEFWGHAFAGFFDNEGHGDLMDRGGDNKFNPQHTQFLRDLMKLTPQNYGLPKNEIRIELIGNLSVGGVFPPEKGISAVVFTPSGTKQLYSEVWPDDGEGPSIIEHVRDLGLIHAWSETGKKIPYRELSLGKAYTWRVCSSGSSLPLSDQGPDQDPRWREVEAWPGKFFPNPCTEVKFETPDGMFRVYLPVVGR